MSTSTTRRHSRRLVPAALLSLLLVTAACGSSDDDSNSGSDSGSSADRAALFGEANAASGDPIKIGVITSGQTQAFDTSAEIDAAEAVAKYANDYLGGLAGRPIEIVSCEEGGTPAGGQECGNQFVQEGVAAVVGAGPAFIDSTLQVVQPTGVPVVLGRGATQAVLSSPGVFVFGNPLAYFGVPAANAAEQQIDNTALVLLDVPAVTGPANALGGAIFGNAGVTGDVVAIAPGTADMTPQIQAAEEGDPGQYFVLGDPTFCASAIRAIKTLGISTPLLVADGCINTDAGASIPGGYEGVSVVAQTVLDPEDDDVQLAQAVLDEYAPDIDLDAISGGGYQTALGFITAVNAAPPAELTSESITTALQQMPEEVLPLSHGSMFQCNGEALAGISPNVCSSFGIIADSTEDGTLSNYRSVDTEGLYNLG